MSLYILVVPLVIARFLPTTCPSRIVGAGANEINFATIRHIYFNLIPVDWIFLFSYVRPMIIYTVLYPKMLISCPSSNMYVMLWVCVVVVYVIGACRFGVVAALGLMPARYLVFGNEYLASISCFVYGIFSFRLLACCTRQHAEYYITYTEYALVGFVKSELCLLKSMMHQLG